MSLFVFDLFQAKILIIAFAIVFAILPTLLIVFLVYQVVAAFILASLSDRQYIRWLITSLASFVAAVILLGGAFNKKEIVDKDSVQIKFIEFYSVEGFKAAIGAQNSPSSESFGAHLFQPFELQQLQNSSLEILSEDSHNLADGLADWLKILPRIASSVATLGRNNEQMSATTYRYEHANAGQNWGDLPKQVEALNVRLGEKPIFAGLLSYLTNSFTSVMYSVIAISGSNAVERIQNELIKYGQTASFWEKDLSFALFQHKFHTRNYNAEVYAGSGPDPKNEIVSINFRSSPLGNYFARDTLSEILGFGAYQNGTTNRHLLQFVADESWFELCEDSTLLDSESLSLINSSFGEVIPFYQRYNPCAISRAGVVIDSSEFAKHISSFSGRYSYYVDDLLKFNSDFFSSLTSVFEVDKKRQILGCITDVTTFRALAGDDTDADPADLACNTMRRSQISALGQGLKSMAKVAIAYNNTHNNSSAYGFVAPGVYGYTTSYSDISYALNEATENLANPDPTLQTNQTPESTDLAKVILTIFMPLRVLQPEYEIPITGSPTYNAQWEAFAYGSVYTLQAVLIKGASSWIGNFLQGFGNTFGKYGRIAGNWVKKGLGAITNIGLGLGLIELMLRLSIATAVAMAYVMSYYGITITSAIGLALFPVWIVLVLGKLMYQGVVGDSRGGISVFPVLELVGFPLLIGTELCILGAIHTLTVGFLAHGQNRLIVTVLTLLQNQTASIKTGDAIHSAAAMTTVLEATVTLGILIGLGLIPVEIAKVLRRELYDSSQSRAKDQMQSAGQAAAVDHYKLQNAGQQAAAVGQRLFTYAPKSVKDAIGSVNERMSRSSRRRGLSARQSGGRASRWLRGIFR